MSTECHRGSDHLLFSSTNCIFVDPPILNEVLPQHCWSKIDEKNPVEKHILPNMTGTCTACGAKMFPWERSKMKNNGDKTFSLCCSYGSIKLTPFKDPSPQLKNLFENSTSQSKQFLANIRKYNGLVAMS